MRKAAFLILMAFLLSTTYAKFVLSEDSTPEQANEAVSEMDFLWGHVVSVDAESSSVLIGYNDIETSQDKQANINITNDTVLENVAGLNEIATGDSASLDYVLSPSGDMIAKRIWIEKPQLKESEISPHDLQNKDEAAAVDPSEGPTE